MTAKKKLIITIVMIMALAFIALVLYDYFSHRGYDDAESMKSLNETLKLYPNDSSLYESRGRLYFDMGKYDLALLDLKKSIRLSKYNDSIARYYVSCVYLITHDINNALIEIEKAVKRSPSHFFQYALRGLCYDLTGNKTKALADYATFMSDEQSRHYFDYNLFVLYMRRATIYYEKKDYTQALLDIDRAMKIDNKHADSYFFRFMLHIKLDNKAKAMQDLKLALKKGFNDTQTLLSFVNAEKHIDNNAINGLVNDYVDKNKKPRPYIFNNQNYIIRLFLNKKLDKQ